MVMSISFGSEVFGRICAVSRIAEAPISTASAICFSRVMKSFFRSGSFVSSATSRSIWSSPPNQRPVTTEMQGAPAAVYSATSSGIVRSPISSSPSPVRRLTSMISGRRAASRASTKGP